MAPSPEQRNEPKAPDKTDNVGRSGDNAPGTDTQLGSSKHTSSSKATDSQKKELSDLNDGQLKDLLEEAVSYKCPQDKQGKSEIFLELLEKAEEDERNQRATNASGSQVARHYNTAYTQPNRGRRSKEQPSAAERSGHGGSLQNLHQAHHGAEHGCTVGRRARRKSGTVSARQREGGSLPSCNIAAVPTLPDKITFTVAEQKWPLVQTSVKMDTAQAADVPLKSEYTAIDISNADLEETQSLIANDSLSRSSYRHDEDVEMTPVYDEEDGTEMKVVHSSKIPSFMNYKSCANFEVAPENGRKQVGNDIDSNIVFSVLDNPMCIVENPNEVSSVTRPRGGGVTSKDVYGPSHHVSVLSIPTQRLILQNKDSSADKKSFDENGNNVNSFNSSISNTDYRKKQKSKSKTDRNVTILELSKIKGYVGDSTDVDALVKFIESPTNNEKHHKNNKHIVNNVNSKTHKHVQNFKDETDKGGAKKRSTERRSKDKSEKLKKSNSLEEISKTKLEDLTSENVENGEIDMRRTAKKQATFDDAVFVENKVGDRRSWGTEEGQQYYCNNNSENIENSKQHQKKKDKPKPEIANISVPTDTHIVENIGNIETDFHVVTKKKKSKKRRSTSGVRGNLFNDENRRNNYYERDNYERSNFQAHDRCDADVLYLNNFQKSPEHRRKSACSMPPSDKSNDSSDLDSVHSLPVESTSIKPCLQQVSASSGGTPQASYADIARMANAGNVTNTNNNYNVEVKSSEKWPTVNNNNGKPGKNGVQQTPAISIKNYNFPYLDGYNCYRVAEAGNGNFDKVFTTVTEIEAKHISEAKIKYNAKTGNESKKHSKAQLSETISSPPNSRIPQEQYPALEKTIKTDIRKQNENGKKPANTEIKMKNEQNRSKLGSTKGNGGSIMCNNLSPNSGDVATITKGCDINKKVSPTINASQECHNSNDVVVPKKQIVFPVSVDGSDRSDDSSTVNQRIRFENSKQKRPECDNQRQKHSGPKRSGVSRPAVIIVNDRDDISIIDGSNVSGITFGFEINEKLLSGDLSDAQVNGELEDDAFSVSFVSKELVNDRCVSPGIDQDTVSSASCTSIVTVFENSQTVLMDVKEDFTARFIAPTAKLEESLNYNHDKIVNFVGLAWEDVLNENGGKVQYYSEQ